MIAALPRIFALSTSAAAVDAAAAWATTYDAPSTLAPLPPLPMVPTTHARCAYVLARLELEPLSQEQIKAACKDAAKVRRQRRNDKRFREDLTRRIDAAYESMIVKPKRAKEAAKRAAAEAKACRER